jgi:hypothetical protein
LINLPYYAQSEHLTSGLKNQEFLTLCSNSQYANWSEASSRRRICLAPVAGLTRLSGEPKPATDFKMRIAGRCDSKDAQHVSDVNE